MSDSARSASNPTVYVVDDDLVIREAVCLMLEHSALHPEPYASGEAFLDGYRPGRPGCLLIDLWMPGLSGLQVVRVLRRRHGDVPFVVLTGSASSSLREEAYSLGAVDFLEKPVDGERLLACVRRALTVAATATVSGPAA